MGGKAQAHVQMDHVGIGFVLCQRIHGLEGHVRFCDKGAREHNLLITLFIPCRTGHEHRGRHAVRRHGGRVKDGITCKNSRCYIRKHFTHEVCRGAQIATMCQERSVVQQHNLNRRAFHGLREKNEGNANRTQGTSTSQRCRSSVSRNMHDGPLSFYISTDRVEGSG